MQNIMRLMFASASASSALSDVGENAGFVCAAPIFGVASDFPTNRFCITYAKALRMYFPVDKLERIPDQCRASIWNLDTYPAVHLIGRIAEEQTRC